MSRISDLAGFTTAISTTEDLSVGIITASSFSGNLTGDVTGNADTATTATNAQGLSGSPTIAVTNVTGVAATFTGNVTIGGTLTYQDVSNVDAVGMVTARKGIQVLADGVDITGIGTFEDRITYDGSLGQAGGGTVTYAVTVATKDSTHRYNGSGSGNGSGRRPCRRAGCRSAGRGRGAPSTCRWRPGTSPSWRSARGRPARTCRPARGR